MLQHTDESLYGTDVHEGLVAPDVKDAVVMLQQVKHSLEVRTEDESVCSEVFPVEKLKHGPSYLWLQCVPV